MRFVTKVVIGLDYLPGPLDKWISREVSMQEGEWTDNQTGRPLSAADEKGEYEQYRQRLATRRQVGRNADKPARIVDRYLPDLADETRCYVIRFPHEVMNGDEAGMRAKVQGRGVLSDRCTLPASHTKGRKPVHR